MKMVKRLVESKRMTVQSVGGQDAVGIFEDAALTYLKVVVTAWGPGGNESISLEWPEGEAQPVIGDKIAVEVFVEEEATPFTVSPQDADLEREHPEWCNISDKDHGGQCMILMKDAPMDSMPEKGDDLLDSPVVMSYCRPCCTGHANVNDQFLRTEDAYYCRLEHWTPEKSDDLTESIGYVPPGMVSLPDGLVTEAQARAEGWAPFSEVVEENMSPPDMSDIAKMMEEIRDDAVRKRTDLDLVQKHFEYVDSTGHRCVCPTCLERGKEDPKVIVPEEAESTDDVESTNAEHLMCTECDHPVLRHRRIGVTAFCKEFTCRCIIIHDAAPLVGEDESTERAVPEGVAHAGWCELDPIHIGPCGVRAESTDDAIGDPPLSQYADPTDVESTTLTVEEEVAEQMEHRAREIAETVGELDRLQKRQSIDREFLRQHGWEE